MPENLNSISWQALEYPHYEKNAGWYVTLLAIAVLLIGFFVVVQKDYFAAVTIAILAAVVIFFSRQKPQIIEIRLTSKGVDHGNLHVPYKQIKHFWIVDNHPHKTLNFETSHFLNQIMIIELGEQNAEEVREFLLNFLPEHSDIHPTIAQRAIHWFKF